MSSTGWIDLQRHGSGIETLRAHFEGHAYDPHWHDSYLVGFTEQGVQQFHCRRQRHDSTPGRLFFVEPGELHDGRAPTAGGFTYAMLYLDPAWLQRELRQFGAAPVSSGEPGFRRTLADDPELARQVAAAFSALRTPGWRLARETHLDAVLRGMLPHLGWQERALGDPRLPRTARLARDYLHAHCEQDIGLETLAAHCGVDRFRLSRAFKAAFGLAPHAYLVQLRLARARRCLAVGDAPAEVAARFGFADQSHLGRWFRRAYGLTPADYRRRG
ncbi:AraC family transcriptional regulator [Salinicola sp. JS01]|uniref:AraC family transcriptional regulator n=1 Tax=Salinicola sp. JS01 TaxID=3050071 RepID=UPI0004E78A6B|nr:AraC family transcriptional regulator [Salinicola sp. JS01]KFF48437.1 AraC family transcriptional regulator [Gammaproteobacteria bacterium MFB021]WIX32389.1 AraC family transcriptional regulator [Salinicola sp. JS01]